MPEQPLSSCTRKQLTSTLTVNQQLTSTQTKTKSQPETLSHPTLYSRAGTVEMVPLILSPRLLWVRVWEASPVF